MFAVTFYAKKRIKAAIKNLLGEPGVSMNITAWISKSIRRKK